MPDFPLTINSQEELDAMFRDRLDRARQTWERENNIPTLERERDEARNEARQAQRQGFDRLVQRDARDTLSNMGVKDRKQQDTILRLADLAGVEAGDEGDPNPKQLRDAIKAVHKDVPGVFPDGAEVRDEAPDTGSDGGETGGGETLTRERIEQMGPDEINSNWDRVKAFLGGERG